MVKLLHTLILFFSFPVLVFTQPPSTPANDRLQQVNQRELLQKQSLVNAIPFRNIGPRIMSGRVVDLAVNVANTIEFYVAFASGGLWYTNNNGHSFLPVFDDQAVMTIGAIAVRWNSEGNHEVWVGTGEVNSSRSSYSGVGIFKSLNGGKTWTHLGLPESHHIGKIILHPSQKNTAFVSVLGHLYSANTERGVYKTTDGGTTWKQLRYIVENTGCVNLAIVPANTNTIYANMWYRTRRAWNFEESGKTSGIYKSIDGGETWNKISNQSNGLPDGSGFGRSGVAVFPKNPNILYCVIDNQNHRPDTSAQSKDIKEISGDRIDKMTKEEFLKLDDIKLNEYLTAEYFPKRYTASTLKDMVRKNKITPHDIAIYTNDANSLLFKTPIIGAEVYKSIDGGLHWTLQNKTYLDNVYNTYGYYFGQIEVSPVDEKKVFTYGVPLLKSANDGATWTSIDGDNVHGDYHALWINPNNSKHLICGNDGGLNISYDEGEHWIKCNSIPVAQCYSVNVDYSENYNVYAGMQDNNVWTGPHQGDESVAWHQEGAYPFKPLLGGDGMQVQIDKRDNNTVYTGYQFGNYFRIDKSTGTTKALNINENIGEEKLRWNWNTPLIISKSSEDILYWGSNKLHRSLNKGETWKTISDDLTQGKKAGDIAYGTLTTIDESALQLGLIYTGSDDGKVSVTQNGGNTWNEIGNNICTQLNIPQQLWVSRVIASATHLSRVYVTLNGYRNDNFKAYVFVSNDYGNTWKNISNNLPQEPVNVIREDNTNENILYLGTDYGVYLSLDAGTTWMRWNNGVPNVAVHDMVIQERENHLVVGTHGRSILIADISLLKKLDPIVLSSSLKLLNEPNYRLPKNLGKRKSYTDYNPSPLVPGIDFHYYAKQTGTVTFKILDSESNVLFEKNDTAEAGLNTLRFNYMVAKPKENNSKKPSAIKEKAHDGNYYIAPGDYKIEITGKNAKSASEITFTVK